MKFIKVSGLVFLLHAVLAAVLVFQSGCQNVQYPQETSCPYVIEQEPVAPMASACCPMANFGNKENKVVQDTFMGSSCSVVSEPVQTGRFKPMRPTYDFSNDGLLTSLDDLEPKKPVSTKDSSGINAQESYTVKSGDSLWVIAKRYNIGTMDLANANGISRDATLKVGQKLVVPIRENTNASLSSPAADGGSYTIAKGDTLSEIAMRFKVSVDAIKRANNMQNNNIVAGKKITIPGISSQQIATVTPVAKSTSTSMPVSKEGAYHVQNGDSLSVIANRFGVTVADLMTWNNISDAKKLRAGQPIVVKNPNSQVLVEELPFTTNNVESSRNDYNVPENEVSSPEEESLSFDFFADDDLFSTTDEIPVVTVDEE